MTSGPLGNNVNLSITDRMALEDDLFNLLLELETTVLDAEIYGCPHTEERMLEIKNRAVELQRRANLFIFWYQGTLDQASIIQAMDWKGKDNFWIMKVFGKVHKLIKKYAEENNG